MSDSYHVQTNNQNENLNSYNLCLTKELLSTFQSDGVSKISLKIDENNNYQLIHQVGNIRESFDCNVLNEKKNTELYRLRRVDGFSQIGNIIKKITVSSVSRNMHQRIEKTTVKSNRKAKKIRKLGTPKKKRGRMIDEGEDGDDEDYDDDDDDEDEDDDEDDDDEEEEEEESDRKNKKSMKKKREMFEEEEEEEPVNDFLREARIYLDSVLIGPLPNHILGQVTRLQKSLRVVRKIENMQDYYRMRENFHKKYKVYDEIDTTLRTNSDLFTKLVEYHERIRNKDLKVLFKQKIDALHLCREAQVNDLHKIYREYHKEIKSMKDMIEEFTREEKRKRK